MQTGNLGSMRFVFHGEWEPQSYTINSSVRYGNSTYIAVRDTEAIDIPGVSNGWALSLYGDAATPDLMGMGYVARESEIVSGKTDEDRNGASAFVDVEGVAIAINQHPVVVETWRSNDGNGFYRKWSDGFIEQGGWVDNSDSYTIINLYTPYSTTGYQVLASLGIVTGPYYPYVHNATVISDSHTFESFSLFIKNAENVIGTRPMWWRTAGY